MALKKDDTPALVDPSALVDPKLPVEPVANSPARTAFLDIDLEIQARSGEKPAAHMTAVFAPNPGALESRVNVLLWFHGWKGQLAKTNLAGFTVQQHFNVPQFKLRDFILKSKRSNFLLVEPTLGDTSEFGLLEKEDQLEAFLQQAVNAAKTHLGAKCTTVGDLVFGAHSGGGLIMAKVVGFNGAFFKDRIRDVWCVDSTYPQPRAWVPGGVGETFISWMSTTPEKKRLFVFSTGEFGQAALDPVTKQVPEVSAAHPAVSFGGTGNEAKKIFDFAKKNKAMQIQVRINQIQVAAKNDVRETSLGSFTTDPFHFAIANEHNASVGTYFTALVDSSPVLS
jgi:hypothetical protein